MDQIKSPQIIKPLSSDGKENRKYHRTSINVQVSCVSLSEEGLPLDQNKGYLIDASQGGMAIEADGNALSDRIAIFFTDADSQVVGILGKVAYARKNANGKYHIGVAFLATPEENIRFVSKAVRVHHYYKNAVID